LLNNKYEQPGKIIEVDNEGDEEDNDGLESMPRANLFNVPNQMVSPNVRIPHAVSEVQASTQLHSAFNAPSNNPTNKNSSSQESNEQGSVINPDEKKRSDKSDHMLDESQENGQEEEGYVSEELESDDKNIKLKSKENTLRFFKSSSKSIG